MTREPAQGNVSPLAISACRLHGSRQTVDGMGDALAGIETAA